MHEDLLDFVERYSRRVTAWCGVSQHLRLPTDFVREGAPFSYEEALQMFDVLHQRTRLLKAIVRMTGKKGSDNYGKPITELSLEACENRLELMRRYLDLAEDFYGFKGSGQSQQISDRRHLLDESQALLDSYYKQPA